MKQGISLIVNGEARTVDVEPTELLLDVLREKLGVKGPKFACDTGTCGACTVLLNGKSVRSCMILAVEVDGQEIMTVEGFSRNELTPLQESFVEHSSFQCGFCASGMTMVAVELLNKNPDPTKEEVKEAISGNLCRCTGYHSIVQGILGAARKIT
ncbi:MAG: (2Fe-2S)-binding protein [delta proteobacterium MLS_D]|jgi:aerobic-type carbon monoxide dehydrogenase small subunit (CoxS/CutS family)|nr:MAG: (2Fe-2S)-binding protein [delta proteobacterium MLS_D]